MQHGSLYRFLAGFALVLLCSVSGLGAKEVISHPAVFSSSEYMDAVEHRHFDKVQSMLKLPGADVNSLDMHRTALFWAIRWNDMEMAEFLLKRGADPDGKAGDDPTLFAVASILSTASDAQRLKELKLLLRYGVSINQVNAYGQTPLFGIRSPVLAMALIKAGVDVKRRDADGNTALEYAIRFGSTEIAAILLNNGADPNGTSSKVPPLFTAVDPPAFPGIDPPETISPARQVQLIRLLADHGGDVNRADKFGNTALFRARKPSVIKALLDAGADATHHDKAGDTVLTKTAYAECLPLLMNIWLDAAPDIKRDGSKALLYCSLWSRLDVVKRLIAMGADVNHRDRLSGRTVLLDLVLDRPHQTAIRVLLDAGADPNIADSAGLTPLMAAAAKPDPELVEMLLDAGANPRARAIDGKQALDEMYVARNGDYHPPPAVMGRFNQVQELLMGAGAGSRFDRALYKLGIDPANLNSRLSLFNFMAVLFAPLWISALGAALIALVPRLRRSRMRIAFWPCLVTAIGLGGLYWLAMGILGEAGWAAGKLVPVLLFYAWGGGLLVFLITLGLVVIITATHSRTHGGSGTGAVKPA